MRRSFEWVLDFAPAALMDFAFHVDFFTLQHLLDDGLRARGAPTSFALALFSAFQTVVYIAACPLLGHFSDRIGRRLSAGSGALLFAVVTSRFLFDAGEWWFYASMAVLGLGGALFWPAAQARLGERNGRDGLGAALVRFNLGWTVGKALGFEVAGRLTDAHLPRVALVVAGAASALAVILVALDTAPARDIAPDREGPSSALPRTLKRGFLIAGLATLVAAWGAQKTLFALIPDLGRAIDLDARHQGRILALLVLAQSAAFVLMRRPSRWAYGAKLLLALAPLTAAGAVGVFYSQGYASALVPALALGLISGCAYTESIFYGIDYDDRRGLRMGVNEAAIGVGGLLPLAGGRLAQWSNEVRVPYLVVAWVALIAAFMAASSISSARRRASSSA